MSYFKAKMHQIQFLAGAPPQTPLRELTALPNLCILAGFQGPTSKGRGGKKGMEEGEEERGQFATVCDVPPTVETGRRLVDNVT